MQKTIYLLFSFCFCIALSNAQTQDWQWAKRGGGNSSMNTGSVIYSTGRDRVLEVAVDGDNNYYFLAEINSNNANYDGESITTYGNSNRKDIFIFSTTCEGNFRWKKTIGGGFSDYANSLKVDNNNNVYVSGKTISFPNFTSVHFDTDTIKAPAPAIGNLDESFKGAFILKYNQDGDFQWLVEPEGILSSPLNGGVLRMDIDENNTVHTLLIFLEGEHLDGQLVVDEDDSQTVIAKFDEDGNLLSYVLIDLEPGYNIGYDYQMVYDSNLDRYYIADTKRNGSDVISINGFGEATGNQKGFYLAAIDNQGEVIWHQESSRPNSWTLGDIKLDNNGDIYFTGVANSNSSENDTFAGHVFEYTPSAGNGIPFLVKLDSDGDLIWGTNADLSTRFPGRSIALGNNDVYVGLGMTYSEWDNQIIDGIELGGFVPDPTLLRFNANTGSLEEVIRMPDNTSGQDEIMSIALDLNQNIIMGGHFSGTLLASHPLPTLSKLGGDSDFFIAKYGTNNCSLSTADFNTESLQIKVYPNPAKHQVFFESSVRLNQVEVFNLQGKSLLQANLVQNNKLDIQNLKAGLYILKITSQNGEQITKKLIVE